MPNLMVSFAIDMKKTCDFWGVCLLVVQRNISSKSVLSLDLNLPHSNVNALDSNHQFS